ncbi:unnamed protein product [Heterobilharzia americana]|nr:unnamed protein product [Heterobilharzia americana]
MDNQSEVYSITTALCGSVYTVNFVDSSADNFEKNLEVQIRDCIDAFLVVYAIDDQNSFEAARLIINALTPLNDRRQFSMLSPKKMNNSVTTLPGLIYLVANKSDLVRGRQVPSDESDYRFLYKEKMGPLAAYSYGFVIRLFLAASILISFRFLPD